MRPNTVKQSANGSSGEEAPYKINVKQHLDTSTIPATIKCSSSKTKWKQIARNAFHRSHRQTNKIEKENELIINQMDNNLEDKNLTLLQLLALHSLELTIPASDIVLKKESNEWIQLSGHNSSFAIASPGTIWKKCASNEIEINAYKSLLKDNIRPFVPQYFGEITYKGDNYIEIEDLLYGFNKPFIMDIKLGTRTFLESEVSNCKLRPDLYNKMIKLNKNAPTEEEHQLQAITKQRYMKFREDMSSSSNLGFRIEGYKTKKENISRDLSFIKTREDVKTVLNEFLPETNWVIKCIIERLKLLRAALSKSKFFKTHEIIGSSLLIIYDCNKVGIWMIDFAKTVPLPEGVKIDHKSKWVYGNHEDGYLFGINNLIDILEEYHRNSI